jgi:dolichyl-diphosphooligosaccharide--protein glycosyltransferase
MADEHSSSVKKDDDEVSLDFGKIFSFFKKKDKHAVHETHTTYPEHHDASHATHAASAEHTTHHAKETDEEMSVDFNKLGGFFKKNYIWLLILIPIILSVAFRMPPASLPMTDQWATSNIQGFIKQDLSSLVNQNYPNLPVFNKNSLVETEFAKAIAQDSYTIKTGQYKGQTVSIKDEIAKSSESLKEFWRYDANGEKFTYMPDIDPYTYLRYARNYLEKGQLGDEVKNGAQWDNHMVAPLGSTVGKTGHPYVLVLMYKIMHIFKPSIDLMNAAAYFPILFSLLAVIPAFFIGRKLAGNVGGFFAAVMVAINPAFLSRTTWGHADTDAYVIFFALAITWLFLEAFDAKKLAYKLVLAGCAGALTGLFSYFWVGWWYIFDFILVAAGAYFIYLLVVSKGKDILNNKSLRNVVLISIAFVASTFLIGSIFVGFNTVTTALSAPFNFISIKQATHVSLWPNVFTTVAELNSASFSQIVSAIGGKLLLLLALVGVALALLKKDENGKTDPKYFLLLAIWFAATIYASTKGIRFTLLIVPAFSIAFGTALGKAYEYANKWGEKGMHLSKKIIAPVVILIFVLMLLGPAKAWYSSTVNDIPMVNDAWWSTLTKINTDSKPDAIINSWWDFGHHFKYIADRAVTFDGLTQNSPMAHWIGKALLTSDEKLATGILRMLDCGSNTAFEELDKKINDASQSVKLLYKVVVLDKEEAVILLKDNGLSVAEAENVLKHTHCEPPEDYFITSDDMIGKAGVWAHFGSWDFDRADMWLMHSEPKDKFVKALTQNNNYSDKDAERLYAEVQGITDETEANSWIAPWPNYASGLADCTVAGTAVECGGGITVDLKTMNVTIQAQQGTIVPSSIVYVDGKEVVEKKFDSASGYSVSLIPSQDSYVAIVMQEALATSMFNRLYFFNGQGLSYFKPFDVQRQLTGGMIYTWKVDWEGKEKNEVFGQNKTKQETSATSAEPSSNKTAAENASSNASETNSVLIE